MRRYPKLCNVHKHGVSVDMPAFFYADCERCEEKKAAGKVTGTEGPLPKHWKARNPRIDWVKRKADIERVRSLRIKEVRAHMFVGRQ